MLMEAMSFLLVSSRTKSSTVTNRAGAFPLPLQNDAENSGPGYWRPDNSMTTAPENEPENPT